MTDRDAVLRELAAQLAAALRCSPACAEPPAGLLLDHLGVSGNDSPEQVEAALRAALGIAAPPAAGRSAPLEVIDLTETGGSPRSAEVLTEAGVVRVDTGTATARSGQPVVLVAVDPNTRGREKTAPGGNWSSVVRFRDRRTEVVLTRVKRRPGSDRAPRTAPDSLPLQGREDEPVASAAGDVAAGLHGNG